jgi:hypothetical protein
MSRFLDVMAGKPADNDGLNTEVRRLDALPLPQLAAEVMIKGFGPGSPGEGLYADLNVVGAAFSGPFQGRDYDDAADALLMEIVAEGVQVLEHAGLVRPVFHGSGGSNDVHYALAYGATRRGRAALQQNAVERVLAGSSA